MAGNFFNQRQEDADPWGRGNNQQDMFPPWRNKEDQGGLSRREMMQLEQVRRRNQEGMRRDDLDSQMQPGWYGDEEFLEERFNESRLAAADMEPLQQGSGKRVKTQQRFEEMANSVFQNEVLLQRQEASQKRTREKDYDHDGISGPYTDPVWDRSAPVRKDYYHGPVMGMGDGNRDRSAARYEDELQSRPMQNFNFDFTDKGTGKPSATPVLSGWNKPVPAGAETGIMMSPKRKKKKKKTGTSPVWNEPGKSNSTSYGDNSNAPQRPGHSGGDLLYTRRPRRDDDLPRQDVEESSNWTSRPVSNMDVYKMRMKSQAEQLKRQEAEFADDKLRDVISTKSTYSMDSDEYLYQDKPPAPQRPSVSERKDPFWENLNKSSNQVSHAQKFVGQSRESVERDKEVQKQPTSIGDVLVQSLLKHISQTVDSGKQLGSGMQKEGEKSTDLAQQLMTLLSNATTESRAKEEPKEEPKVDHAAFESRLYKSDAAESKSFGRNDDSRMFPASHAPPQPDPVMPVNTSPAYGAPTNYGPGYNYAPAAVPFSYSQPQSQAPTQTVSQADFQYGRSLPSLMQPAYIRHKLPPPIVVPPGLPHPIVPQPVPPPVITPFLPRPQMTPIFANFGAMAPTPIAPFLPNSPMRFGVTNVVDNQKNQNRNTRWAQNSNLNARKTILTPIPAKDKGNNASKSAGNIQVKLTRSAQASSNSVASAFKIGFNKPKPASAKATNSSWDGPVLSAKSVPFSFVPKDASSMKSNSSASKDSSSSKRDNSFVSKNGSSALKDAKSSKDTTVSSHSSSRQKAAPVPIPKTMRERRALVEQEAQLKKKVELLKAELNRLKTKCTGIMQNLQASERVSDPKLTEAKKLQSEIKIHVDLASDELLAVGRALKASKHLTESTPKEKTPVLPKADSKSKQSDKSKGIVLNLKPSSREKTSTADVKPLVESDAVAAVKNYRFVDNGDHWCKHCDVILPVADDLLKHLQRKHYDVMQRLPPDERPWAAKSPEHKLGPGEKFTYLPFRGVEFMIPCDSFFCNLCKELFGDVSAARNHLRSLKHNANYSKFCKSNPDYAKHIQSVLNAQKKQDKKSISKDAPTGKAENDATKNPSKDKKDRRDSPEVINIDEDEATKTSKLAKSSGKETSGNDNGIVASADGSEQASKLDKIDKDGKEKGKGDDVTKSVSSGDTKEKLRPKSSEKENKNGNKSRPNSRTTTAGKRPREKSYNTSENPKSAKRTKMEDVFEKVSDEELFEDINSESNDALQVDKDSTVKPLEENVFDKISDDEMAEEPENEVEMVTDDADINIDVADKKASDAKKDNAVIGAMAENLVEVEEAVGENATDKANGAEGEDAVDEANEADGDDVIDEFDDEAMADDADITIIDDADEDDANEGPTEILIEDITAEECENTDNPTRENKDEGDGDSVDKVGVVEADEDEDAVILDKEDEVIDNVDEDAEDDEFIDNAEEDVVDEVTENADEDDEVIDNADEVDVDEVTENADEDVIEDEAVENADEDIIEDEALENVDEDIEDEAMKNADKVSDNVDKEDNAVEENVDSKDNDSNNAEEEDGVAEKADQEDGESGTVTEENAIENIAAAEVQDAVTATKDIASNGNIAEGDLLSKENLEAESEAGKEVAADNTAEAMDTEEVLDKDVPGEKSNIIAPLVQLDEGKHDEIVLDSTSDSIKCVVSTSAMENAAKVPSMEGDTMVEPTNSSDKVSESHTENLQPTAEKSNNDVAKIDSDPFIGEGAEKTKEPDQQTEAAAASVAENQKEDGGKETSQVEKEQSTSPNLQSCEVSGDLQVKVAVEIDTDTKTANVASSGLIEALSESSSNDSVKVAVETPSKGSPRIAAGKSRQMAICSRGRGRGAQRGVSPRGRGAKQDTPAPSRVGTRSSSAASVPVPIVETSPRLRRQPQRAKPPVIATKEKSGRPIRGKTAAAVDEPDVIDLDSPDQPEPKKLVSPEVIAEEAKPSMPASRGRSRRKITPRRADLLVPKVEVKEAEEKPEAEEVPLKITEVVTLDDEENKKLNWSIESASEMEKMVENQDTELENMDTSELQGGDDNGSWMEPPADLDESSLEKMEAILLRDPSPNSPEADEADDACLESDLEIVDEADESD